MKELIKKFIPSFVLSSYHLVLAKLSAAIYGWPSEKLIVIGVTGTNGKSSVAGILAQLLNLSGKKTGLSSTVQFSDGEKETLNNRKMTMLGRFFLQSQLRHMVNNDCRYAVIETTSEGILQHRHSAIHYDTAIFTNLAPEHLERHGGFDNYKKAKLKLFKHLERLPNKAIDGQKVLKVIVVNGNDESALDFLDFDVDRKIVFGMDKIILNLRNRNVEELIANEILITSEGTTFIINGQKCQTRLLGSFNVENILAAVGAVMTTGMTLEQIVPKISKLKGIPGRMEKIDEGQNFQVVVDYAPEPNSLKAAYDFLQFIPKKRLIHVLGSAGGGRDKARREVLGRMAGEHADAVIVTNEDPYDEDPQDIIKSVGQGVEKAGKKLGIDLWMIEDRREAIAKAFAIAESGDLVLLTGKGAEQAIVGKSGHLTPWDEREVARELLQKIQNK